jgi:pimeloyl-ACP methyl ester carboxylesterase
MATTTTSDGITLHYESQGDGAPALVFVHGWCCNRHHWDRQLAHFSPQYQTVAIDLAGHGESSLGREVWTMSAFGADVAAIVEALALKEIVLIGHSMGGPVIIEPAQRLEGKVIGMVGVDYFKNHAAPPTPDEIDEAQVPFRQDFVATAQQAVRNMFNDDADPALRDQIIAAMSAAPAEIATYSARSWPTRPRNAHEP